MPEKLITDVDVADRLGVALASVRRARWSGAWNLPFIKIGNGAVRYRPEDVTAFIERGRRTSTSDSGREAA